MSWSDDNVTYPQDEITIFEYYWKKGLHIDRKGNLHKLDKITNEYLTNIINYFDLILDTSPVEEQLEINKLIKNV